MEMRTVGSRIVEINPPLFQQTWGGLKLANFAPRKPISKNSNTRQYWLQQLI
jgi:hypothetical protein